MTRPVISAEDVRAVHRARGSRLELPADALVTPLARDEADRWGIELATASPPAAAPPPASHAPTCDTPAAAGGDDALEQIVTRVQVRVPQADPAQVREIARRVLDRVRRSP